MDDTDRPAPPAPGGAVVVPGLDVGEGGVARLVLDANVFVGAGFTPESASGRLVTAAREARLLVVWNAATRAEAERVVGQIPPLASFDWEEIYRAEGEHPAPLDLRPFEHVAGRLDQTLAALAHAASAPLVTADGPLAGGAQAGGVAVLRPAQAAGALGLNPGRRPAGTRRRARR